jgi:uncharacterized protein (TIGR00251 family)
MVSAKNVTNSADAGHSFWLVGGLMLISVRVIPRSSKNGIEWEQGGLKVRLKAPPVDGAANEALVALLAEQLGVPKRAISIVRGVSGRQKTVEVIGIKPEDIEQKLKENR